MIHHHPDGSFENLGIENILRAVKPLSIGWNLIIMDIIKKMQLNEPILNLELIYLQTPKRIEALLFLFKIALQMAVLIERSALEKIKAIDNDKLKLTRVGNKTLVAEKKNFQKSKSEIQPLCHISSPF